MPLHFYPIPYSTVNTELFLHIPTKMIIGLFLDFSILYIFYGFPTVENEELAL